MVSGSLVSASIKVDPYFHIQLLKRPACKNLFSQTALLSDCTGKQSYFSNRPSYVTARENIFSQTGLLKVHLEVLYHVSLLTIQFFSTHPYLLSLTSSSPHIPLFFLSSLSLFSQAWDGGQQLVGGSGRLTLPRASMVARGNGGKGGPPSARSSDIGRPLPGSMRIWHRW